MKCLWKDLEISVSFKCTRVHYITKEYWGKLRRVLNYLKAAKDDRKIMGSGDLLKIETWVDASHTVHEEMMGHTGGCMYCVVSIIHGKTSKQKLNTKITIYSEVVPASEYVPYKTHMINIFWDNAILCTKMFCIKKKKVKLRWRRMA